MTGEQLETALFNLFTRDVQAQRLEIALPEFDTCTVCGVSLPMGDEFDDHCCCGRGLGTNPDCQRCHS